MPDPRNNGGKKPEPSLMQNLGGFFRGIAEGFEDDEQPAPPVQPAQAQAANEPADERTREVGRKVQEVRRGDYIYRRTTIDEVIFDPAPPDEAQA
jgi:hypothetical protein